MSYWTLAKRASQPGFIDFGRQQQIYELETGDRPSFVGFVRPSLHRVARQERPERNPTVNLCCACDTDFASVSAFDKHRIGKHAYTYSEGLKFDPPVEDGRRCMDVDEMTAAGMELDARGRWTITADRKRITEYWWKAA